MRRLLKNRLVILALCILFGLIASKVPGRLTITRTSSVKYRVFWTMGADTGKLKKGRYLRANHSLELPQYKCSPCSIVKKVGCMPGDRLDVKDGMFFCNDEFLCKAMAINGIDYFHHAGAIPAGHLFVMGDSKNSYDSRYFGLISFEDIDALLIPIF